MVVGEDLDSIPCKCHPANTLMIHQNLILAVTLIVRGSAG